MEQKKGPNSDTQLSDNLYKKIMWLRYKYIYVFIILLDQLTVPKYDF